MSKPTSAPSPAEGEGADELDGTLIDTVARFIADSGPIQASPERELHAPRRSLAALELLDAPEEGAEASDLHGPVSPPALPPDVKPTTHNLPPLLLASMRAQRADSTERVTTIPRTHPMANSIAPGGSPLTVPPAPRRNLRWQAALGVAALLLIGGASRLLQSRGEHHAASGARALDEDEGSPETRRAPVVAQPSEEELSARARAEALRLEAERLASERASLMSLPAPSAEPPVALRVERSARPARVEQADQATGADARKVRIGLGGAQLLERAQAEDADPSSAAEATPDRRQIAAALSKLTPQLQACVGDEHAIADVTLTVRAPGVVSHALVQGAYAGSDKGSCIARTLRDAKLPPFAAPVSRVEYPFQL